MHGDRSRLTGESEARRAGCEPTGERFRRDAARRSDKDGRSLEGFAYAIVNDGDSPMNYFARIHHVPYQPVQAPPATARKIGSGTV